jgi:hypothetical protein
VALLKIGKRLLRALRDGAIALSFSSAFAFCLTLWTFGLGGRGFSASVPPVERLLPDDTLLVVTTPDFPRLCSLLSQSPQGRLWDDPALKAFKDNFITRWTDDIVKPLERDLDIDIRNYADMAQGQVTLAFTRNSGREGNGDAPGLILLMDAKDKITPLRSMLAGLRKKWVDAGRIVRVEKIRDFEFLLINLSTNDAPRTFKQFFSLSAETPQLGPEAGAARPAPKTELVIGRADSLLIVASSLKSAEKVVARLVGTGPPTLGEVAAYHANQPALFRDAPVYAWLNTKALNESSDTKGESAGAATAPELSPVVRQDKYTAASGLIGIQSVAVALRSSPEGTLVQANFTAPESIRQSLFKIPPGESRDCTVPSFVPADAVTFERWRVDGQQAFAAFEKFLAEVSPQAANGISAILDLANQNARLKDPDFDVRKNLIGNLGNDLIMYSKAPRSLAPNDLESPPGITLISSPNPDQFVAALQSVLVFMSAQAEHPEEREFLGRRILSVPLPALAIPLIESRPHPARTIHYAASGGYVALSTDASLLEEFLRRSENQGRTLRETAGLNESAQKVLGPGTILFGFNNQAETFRGKLEELKVQGAASKTPPPDLPLPAFGTPEKSVRDWMDFSLMPSFDAVSKYFHFSVYSVSAGPDGFTYKYFLAAPPALRSSSVPTASR